MLIRTCPHKPPTMIKVAICNHQVDIHPTLRVAWYFYVWWFPSIENSMVIYDTGCPHWNQVSLDNTALHIPKQSDPCVMVLLLEYVCLALSTLLNRARITTMPYHANKLPTIQYMPYKGRFSTFHYNEEQCSVLSKNCIVAFKWDVWQP